MKATSSGKSKYLPFTSIVQMAKDSQKPKRGMANKTVMWASQRSDGELPTSDYADHRVAARTSEIRRSREFRNRSRFGSPPPSSDQRTQTRRQLKPAVKEARAILPSGSDDDQPRARGKSTSPRCSHCWIPGHVRDECWRALKLCLICGKGHSMDDCPRYNPRHRSNSRKRDAPSQHLN